MATINFAALSDDILFLILSYLSPPDLLRLRQTCSRLSCLSRVRAVWVSACNSFVLANRYPFPRNQPLDAIPTSDLERYTVQGFRLASKWRAWTAQSGRDSPGFRSSESLEGHSGSAVTEVCLLPSRNLLLTVSKSIWMVVTIWSIPPGKSPQRLCEWSPRGALFRGVAVNSDPDSPAIIAISVIDQSSEHHVHILSLNEGSLESLISFPTMFVPMTLQGTRVALCDDRSQTAIWDWSTSHYAVLDEDLWEEGNTEQTWIHRFQHNLPAQVLFAHRSILVVRARSLSLFSDPPGPTPSTDPQPAAPPLARHSFGWLDGVSVAPQLERDVPPSYNILLRAESDDPWRPPSSHSLDLYSLRVNPDYSPDDPQGVPYVFPPTYQSKIPTSRGALRCPGLRLCKCGTVIWVRPGESVGRTSGLVQDPGTGYTDADWAVRMPISFHRPFSGRPKECLMAAVLPGSSLDSKPDRETTTIPSMKLLGNQELHDWTCLDYDEDLGHIAIGKGDGSVQLLAI